MRTLGLIRIAEMRFCFKNLTKLALLGLALGIAMPANPAEYDCKVSKKFEQDRQYSIDQLARLQFGNRIEVTGEEAWVSRCSYSQSAGKVTCDRLKIDRVVNDPNVRVKKFYLFSAQFDLQLYPDLTYIENNGRGSVSFGRCVLLKQ